jgi:hypothetical protein
MKHGLRSRAAAAAAAMLALVGAGRASAQPVQVALDQEATVGGVGVACTGIGQTKDDPKWRAYPVLVEFARPSGDYIAGETLSVADSRGHALLEVSCEGPWILLKLTPGQRYVLSATAANSSDPAKQASIRAPSHGQARSVFTFPAAPAP